MTKTQRKTIVNESLGYQLKFTLWQKEHKYGISRIRDSTEKSPVFKTMKEAFSWLEERKKDIEFWKYSPTTLESHFNEPYWDSKRYALVRSKRMIEEYILTEHVIDVGDIIHNVITELVAEV